MCMKRKKIMWSASKTDRREEQWVPTLTIHVFPENLVCAMLKEHVHLFLSHNICVSATVKLLEYCLVEAHYYTILDTWNICISILLVLWVRRRLLWLIYWVSKVKQHNRCCPEKRPMTYYSLKLHILQWADVMSIASTHEFECKMK